MRRSKTLLVGVLFSAALLLGACSSDPETPDGTGDPNTTDTAGGGGGGQECLLGTWQVDVQDLADQVMGLMAVPGATKSRVDKKADCHDVSSAGDCRRSEKDSRRFARRSSSSLLKL